MLRSEMDALIPTMKLELSDQRFHILEIAINPVFRTLDRIFYGLPTFEIWVELVLGHNEEDELSLPAVTFNFSSAFRFRKQHEPPLTDFRGPYAECENKRLYEHFWFTCPEGTDLLPLGFGRKAQRLVPQDQSCMTQSLANKLREISDNPQIHIATSNLKAALAFTRNTYEGEEQYCRTNYPCTFDGRQEAAGNGSWRVVASPWHFRWEEGIQRADRSIRLSKHESISFWYCYPYNVLTGAHDVVERRERLPFYHRVVVHKDLLVPFNTGTTHRNPIDSVAHINYFPRFPFRYDIGASTPTLTGSPRLPVDPPNWQSEYSPMYPARSPPDDLPEWEINGEYLIFTQVIDIVDSRFEIRRTALALLIPLLMPYLGIVLTRFGWMPEKYASGLSFIAILVALLWLYEFRLKRMRGSFKAHKWRSRK